MIYGETERRFEGFFARVFLALIHSRNLGRLFVATSDPKPVQLKSRRNGLSALGLAVETMRKCSYCRDLRSHAISFSQPIPVSLTRESIKLFRFKAESYVPSNGLQTSKTSMDFETLTTKPIRIQQVVEGQ
jgi:hypothetical protein